MDFEPRVKKVRLSSRSLFFTENRASAEFWKLTKFWMNILFPFRALLEQKQTSLVHLCRFQALAVSWFTETRLLDRAITRNWFRIRFPVRFLHFLFTVFRSHDFLHLHYTWFKICPEVEKSRNRSCKWLTFDCIFNLFKQRSVVGIAPFSWPVEDGNCSNDLKDFEVILTTIFVGKNPDSLIECGTHSEGEQACKMFGSFVNFVVKVEHPSDYICSVNETRNVINAFDVLMQAAARSRIETLPEPISPPRNQGDERWKLIKIPHYFSETSGREPNNLFPSA